MNIVQQAARRPERLEALDKVARPGAGAVGRAWCATCTAWEQQPDQWTPVVADAELADGGTP